MDGKLALTIHEAADLLGAHPQTIRKLARKGEIPAFRVGRVWRFHKDALVLWAETHHLRSQKPRILVVDDEKSVRESTGLLLEHAGYQVSTAVNGVEGLEQMSVSLPDVVLLDLHMPVMDGPTMLRQARELHGHFPVIIATGYTDTALLTSALEHGPLLVLGKPVKRQQLLDSVQTVLRVPTTSRE